ncbi:integrase, catalytic region, zinc finger, CCHC-type containing protein [Tanacetum coccineum]
MYALMLKPIPHPLKNNRSAHLNYINHLKESVETVREIVEEARVAKPLDNALNYACQYTKLSQELKKQVTFNDKPGTSSSNTQKHEVHQKVQHTNVPVIHSTRVNTSTEASGSKPRSNTKKNRILPAKSENKKKVEDHPRTNKSVWTKVNLFDLFIRSVNATPTVKIVLNKGKQIWKPKGKLSDNSLNKTKRVWKATGKLFADIGYQWRPTGKKFTLGKLNCGYQWRPTGKKFALGELCPLTKLSVKCCSKHMTGNRSKLKNFVEKFIGTVRFRNDHFGAIMGYGDYVIGDSVISRVYYVEGLRHNLFSVGKFCDSDLEIAFRKHSCFVRDMNGVDLLKGSRSTNLYTISLDDMMKSSPVCLLSKASKTKSWLWHRRLNHLNFGTINDLARKDLAEVVAIACYTQNRSLIHTRRNKTPYELVHDKKPDCLAFLHRVLRVFGALCYPTNDSEDLGPSLYVDDCLDNSVQIVNTCTSVSTTFAQDAPSTSFSPSSFGIQPPGIQHHVAVGPTIEDTLITQATLHPSNNIVTGEPGSAQSSSRDVSIAEPNQVT